MGIMPAVVGMVTSPLLAYFGFANRHTIRNKWVTVSVTAFLWGLTTIVLSKWITGGEWEEFSISFLSCLVLLLWIPSGLSIEWHLMILNYVLANKEEAEEVRIRRATIIDGMKWLDRRRSIEDSCYRKIEIEEASGELFGSIPGAEEMKRIALENDDKRRRGLKDEVEEIPVYAGRAKMRCRIGLFGIKHIEAFEDFGENEWKREEGRGKKSEKESEGRQK